MAETVTQAQADERDRQLTGQSQVVESADRAADRASRERVAAIRLQMERDKISAQSTQQHLDRATGLAQSREERQASAAQQANQQAHETQQAHEDRAAGLSQQREQQAHETQQSLIPKPTTPPSE